MNCTPNWSALIYDISQNKKYDIISLLYKQPYFLTSDINEFEQEFMLKAYFSCVIITYDSIKYHKELVEFIREKNPKIPIIIIIQGTQLPTLESFISCEINMIFNVNEDTKEFIMSRITHLIDEYLSDIKPIFFKALEEYVHLSKYPWHTPGHSGGTMFLTNPIGQMLFDFYGENIFRSDLSISVPDLGSLLDQEGVIKKSEQYSAKAFNSDKTYYVLNGTSTSNQIIWKGRVTKDDLVFVDRNCHKSLNFGIVVTEAIPMYMIPRRNTLGIIGPVKLNEFDKQYIRKQIELNHRTTDIQKKKPIKMITLTNSTYDGLCYNMNIIKELLYEQVENIHIDEAWYAYARFHPLYKHFYAMSDLEKNKEHPPIFVSHSTHKLLGGFSQASMLHIKNNPNKKLDLTIFDQAYLMYGSTSPQYSMIASLDISSAMMHIFGENLLKQTILNAIRLRKKLAHIYNEYKKNDDWFFSFWQPLEIDINGGKQKFEDIPDEYLLNTQHAWLLSTKNNWHGFKDIEDNFIMLDPIKLTLKNPGLNIDGTYDDIGIPSNILSNYMIDRGTVAEKTDTYTLLLLHSIGTTISKQEELIRLLFQFKSDYQNNIPLSKIFPKLVENFPTRYMHQGLKDHCQEMYEYIRHSKLLELMDIAFQVVPDQILTPAEASREVFQGNIIHKPLKECFGETAATIIVPYPPGIPILMGGEAINKNSNAIIEYLLVREKFEQKFPGYYRDIHGIETYKDTNGIRIFHMMVLNNK